MHGVLLRGRAAAGLCGPSALFHHSRQQFDKANAANLTAG